MTTVTYEIDSEDRLRRVGRSWSSFALENGAGHLAGDDVIGTRLWEWVAGSDVQHVYQLLFQKVRERHEGVTLPFRCDSPEIRRFMELTVSPDLDSALVFEARLVRTEARPPVELLDPSTPRSGELVPLCSWCKRALTPGDRWLEIEEAVPALGLFDRPSPAFSHTICPECRAIVDHAD